MPIRSLQSAARRSLQSAARRPVELDVDWTACDGRGLCAELLPELIRRDDWGFPIPAADPVPAGMQVQAERAVRACPRLALRLRPAS